MENNPTETMEEWKYKQQLIKTKNKCFASIELNAVASIQNHSANLL